MTDLGLIVFVKEMRVCKPYKSFMTSIFIFKLSRSASVLLLETLGEV